MRKTLGLLSVFVACAALGLGCENPADNKPKAVVSSAAPAASTAAAPKSAAPAAPAAGEALALAADSKIGFVGAKLTGSHEGVFQKFEGTIELAGGKPEGGKVKISIDTASVKTDAEGLDKHLKAADFFDVEKFPKAAFTSTEIKAGGDKGATHTVTGEFELHGVKKIISFPATIQVGDDAVTATSEFSINRKDFGIAFAGKADDLIKDDVLIKLNVKAPRKK